MQSLKWFFHCRLFFSSCLVSHSETTSSNEFNATDEMLEILSHASHFNFFFLVISHTQNWNFMPWWEEKAACNWAFLTWSSFTDEMWCEEKKSIKLLTRRRQWRWVLAEETDEMCKIWLWLEMFITFWWLEIEGKNTQKI